MVTVTDKIERWKILAEKLISENRRVYIKDFNDEYYFGELLFIGDKTIEIQCFAPKNKQGNKFVLEWFRIIKFDEYKEEM